MNKMNKRLKINKKELMLTDWKERLARLVVASDFFLRYEKHDTMGPISRKQFEEQVEIAKKYIELKAKEKI